MGIHELWGWGITGSFLPLGEKTNTQKTPKKLFYSQFVNWRERHESGAAQETITKQLGDDGVLSVETKQDSHSYLLQRE